MKVITLEQVKSILNITTTPTDAQINAQIPVIDAKVKQICHNNFNLVLFCKVTSGSKYVELYDIGYNKRECRRYWPTPELEQLTIDLPVGTQLEGDSLADLSYIDEVYYYGISNNGINIPSFKLNENATASGNVYIYAGINISYLTVIAKGIMWLIDQANTTVNDTDWKSKRIGPLSLTRGDSSERLDGKSGMPSWFVKGLPRYHS